MPQSAVLLGIRREKSSIGMEHKKKKKGKSWIYTKTVLLILVFQTLLFPSCQSPEKSSLSWKEAFEPEREEAVGPFLRRRQCSGSRPPGLRCAAAGARRALRAADAVGGAAVLRGGLGLLGRLGGSGRSSTTTNTTTTTCGGRARGGVSTLVVFNDFACWIYCTYPFWVDSNNRSCF